ncbi:cholesterol 24-hydroxylase-like isoform X2 [Salvelinus fontinalis]|uniref:cholesterol 24-hydroxylase-like isoform X2 n=1 Tax=Salvelinus fontinalis TaxID=8038 RepID=UPI0024850F04|nr:cholesterol 24-hydroxylase-like isoform X2 [Salvelinus fontinalis]
MALFPFFAGWIGYLLICLLGLIFIAFLCFCLYIKYIHLKYDHIPGPPRDSFLFGHLPTIQREMSNDRVIHDKFLEWAETYGPVYRINGMHVVMLCVTCPDTTKEVLMSPKYPKAPLFYKRLFNLFGQRFFGNGLVTAQNHDEWYKQRRIMDPAFSSLYLRGQMGAFNERAEKLMDKLADMADTNTAANMQHMFNCVTLDVITKVAFGVELDLLKESDSPFPNAIEMCLKGAIHYLRDFTFQNKKFINKVKKSCQLLRSTGRQWINERKMAIQNGEDVPKDILTQILKTAGKEEIIANDDEELMLDNFVTFFIAGQETTANQLAFAVMELGRLPEILTKVRQEVDDVLGMKQEINFDDLGEMTYLSQVLKETLRLYPTAPGTSRFIPNDIVINGIPIPAGVTCVFNSYVCGRLDKFFEDPLKFDPERFHPDAAKPYYCYYPFSLGPRSCLGQSFAQMEAKVVMAKLLQRFDVSLLPGQSFDILDTGSLRPKSGVVCNIRHRGQTPAA